MEALKTRSISIVLLKMNELGNSIYKNLETTTSRVVIDHLVADALQNHSIIGELLELMGSSNNQIAMRSAWVLSHIALKDKALIAPLQEHFVQKVRVCKNESVNRSLAKILSIMPLHPSMDGEFYDFCLEKISLKDTAIANKAYLIEIILKYISQYPELGNEAIALFQILKNDDSPGVRGKINYAIKKINSLKAL